MSAVDGGAGNELILCWNVLCVHVAGRTVQDLVMIQHLYFTDYYFQMTAMYVHVDWYFWYFSAMRTL